MKLDYYLSSSECQVEIPEREELQSIKEPRLTLNFTEIQHLDYIMQDCQGDLHMLCRRTLNENNAVTKQLWEEENKREAPPKGSWSQVADDIYWKITQKCRRGTCFNHMKLCIFDFVMQSLKCKNENDVINKKQSTS